MIKIDLITGFLGSGKTTFLERYAKYLMDAGQRVCILENDYGAVNVDMMLLGHLEGEQCGLEMVAGGCDYDCHRRRFKTKLIAMGMQGYDRVLVEPSGIFDVDEFFDALYEEPLDRWYEVGSVIAVVEAGLEDNLSPRSEYLLGSEIAKAGAVVLSKCQLAEPSEIQHTIAHIDRALEGVHCDRRIGEAVVTKSWDDFTDEDFQKLSRVGYVHAAFRKQPVHDHNDYQSRYYMNLTFTPEEIMERIEGLMADPDCAGVFRVKGFAPTAEGDWMELNCTRRSKSMRPIAKGQTVIIVIGEGLRAESIDPYFQENE